MRKFCFAVILFPIIASAQMTTDYESRLVRLETTLEIYAKIQTEFQVRLDKFMTDSSKDRSELNTRMSVLETQTNNNNKLLWVVVGVLAAQIVGWVWAYVNRRLENKPKR